MMKQQPWIRFAPELFTEWLQCNNEGLDVADLQTLCAEAARIPDMTDEVAEGISRIMHARPIRKDFTFTEPSTLDEIKKCRPANAPTLTAFVNSESFADKVRGAWLTRISGCIMGKPVEGFRSPRLTALLKGTDNYPMHKYVCKADFTEELVKELDLTVNSYWADNLNNMPFLDDDTNYTVFALKLIESYGTDFTADDVLEARLGWMPYLSVCTAERVSYRNATMGMLVPQTATYRNPFREGIGAQIRGDFFGYINPGNPELAAEMAFRDASNSHVKNGIYGEMFIAAAIAAAAVCDDMETIIRVGLSQIPENCRLSKEVLYVIDCYNSGTPVEDLINEIIERFDEHSIYGWCYTVPNAMIVTLALLYGQKDVGKTLCLAVQAAFDTDCNAATAGSIVGMMNGASNIDAYWTTPCSGVLRTSVTDYNIVDIDTLVTKTVNIVNKQAVVNGMTINTSFEGENV